MRALKLISKTTVEDKVDNIDSVMKFLRTFEEKYAIFESNHPEYVYHTSMYLGPVNIGVITAVLKDAEADKGADRQDSGEA